MIQRHLPPLDAALGSYYVQTGTSLGCFCTRNDQDLPGAVAGATRLMRQGAALHWVADTLIHSFQQVIFASAAPQTLVRSENSFAHGHILKGEQLFS